MLLLCSTLKICSLASDLWATQQKVKVRFDSYWHFCIAPSLMHLTRWNISIRWLGENSDWLIDWMAATLEIILSSTHFDVCCDCNECKKVYLPKEQQACQTTLWNDIRSKNILFRVRLSSPEFKGTLKLNEKNNTILAQNGQSCKSKRSQGLLISCKHSLHKYLLL